MPTIFLFGSSLHLKPEQMPWEPDHWSTRSANSSEGADLVPQAALISSFLVSKGASLRPPLPRRVSVLLPNVTVTLPLMQQLRSSDRIAQLGGLRLQRLQQLPLVRRFRGRIKQLADFQSSLDMWRGGFVRLEERFVPVAKVLRFGAERFEIGRDELGDFGWQGVVFG